MPAVAAEYQSTVNPAAGVAFTVTVPEPHLEPATATGAVGMALIFATVTEREADTQPVEVVVACT